jgi:hypothetical protein
VLLAKSLVLWDMTSYQLVNRYLCFGGAFCLHLQSVSSTRRSCVNPEDEDNNLSQKVSDYQLMQYNITEDLNLNHEQLYQNPVYVVSQLCQLVNNSIL